MTLLLSKILGPVLLLRGISVLIDRQHFAAMLDGLEKEVTTVAFSAFPIALLMVCTALAVTHEDTSSLAAILIQVGVWGGILKASALILFPRAVTVKAQMLGKAGFIHIVWVVCLAGGGYFTWFGYGSA